MKFFLITSLVLGSISAFADSRSCKVAISEGIFGPTTSKVYKLSEDIQGAFVRMELITFPSVTFRVRENYGKRILISVEVDGREKFFTTGNDRAYLRYYPLDNDHTQSISISCSL